MADVALWEKIRLKIRQLMEDQGVTHAELAKRSGIVGSQMSHYLGGRNTPSIDKLPAIADSLGVKVSDLLADASPNPTYRKPTPEEMALAVFESLGVAGDRGELIKLLLENDTIRFNYWLEVIKGSLIPDTGDDKAESTG